MLCTDVKCWRVGNYKHFVQSEIANVEHFTEEQLEINCTVWSVEFKMKTIIVFIHKYSDTCIELQKKLIGIYLHMQLTKHTEGICSHMNKWMQI